MLKTVTPKHGGIIGVKSAKGRAGRKWHREIAPATRDRRARHGRAAIRTRTKRHTRVESVSHNSVVLKSMS